MRAFHSAPLLVLLALLAAPLALAADATPSGEVVDMTGETLTTDSVVPPRWQDHGSYPRFVAAGTATATLIITENGSVRDIVIVESSGRDTFDSTFMTFLSHQHFIPGSRNGKPVAVRLRASATGKSMSSYMDGLVYVQISAYSKAGADCLTAAPDVVVSACSTLISAGYDSISSRISRARAYMVLGRDSDALADLTAVEAMHARGGEISRMRGFIYEKRGDYKNAIDDYDDALDVKGNVVAALDRGLTYEALGRTDLATADFKAAAGMLPVNTHNNDPQLAALEQRIAQKPDDISALANRCIRRSVLGVDLTLALADCSLVQSRIAGEPNTLEARGLIHLRLAQFDDAIQDFSIVLASDPKRATSLYLRGVAKLRAGETASAHNDVLAARGIDSAIAAKMASNGVLPR